MAEHQTVASIMPWRRNMSSRVCLHAFASFTGGLLLALASVAPAAVEQAKSADAFVESIGVNTHSDHAVNPKSAYVNPEIETKLADLGIRHLRDDTGNNAGIARIAALHRKHGIRTNLVLGNTSRTPAQLVALLKKNSAYEAIEGLNEPDFQKDGRSYKTLKDDRGTDSYPATKSFQDDLFAAVKAEPKLKHVKVLSPAMGRSVRFQHLMPIPFDVASMHSYAWAAPDQTSHAPSLGVDKALSDMAAHHAGKKLWATESGYFNRSSTDKRVVPEAVAARYMPRLLAEFFNRGIERTYIYELADEGPSADNREENFGLLRFDMTEKPAFVAVENLIDLLQEPSAKAFTPGSLEYTLAVAGGGDLSNVHHTLLQKSNGTFFLLLWQEVGSFDRQSKTEIVNPELPVTLTVKGSFSDAKTYLTNQSLTPTATHAKPTSIRLNVPDQMLVVELNPS